MASEEIPLHWQPTSPKPDITETVPTLTKYDTELSALDDGIPDTYKDQQARTHNLSLGVTDSPLLQGQWGRRRRFWQRSPSSPSIAPTVLFLMSFSIVPTILGAFFYASIGFRAPDGTYPGNGTFVRPVNQGWAFKIGGRTFSSSVSPLLISSISSSVIGFISPLAMSLLAFHLGRRWLAISQQETRHDRLPTPYQYFLLVDLTANTTPLGILRFLRYTILRSSGVGPVGHNRWFRGRRGPIVGILSFAFLWAFIILSFSWSIKIFDVVLHEQIKPTALSITTNTTQFQGDVRLNTKCRGANGNDCGVLNRTIAASSGGLNQSSILSVYPGGASSPRGNIAFLGPPSPSDRLIVSGAPTVAVATQCQVFHPSCFVSDEAIQNCVPDPDPPNPPLASSQFIWNPGFNTSQWGSRLQVFMTLQGNLTYGNRGPLSAGSNLNPFTTTSFGCFKDFSNIFYNDTDNVGLTSPFLNWWSYGPGIKTTPYLLCSISLCNTTVYDATYNLERGVISLANDSFRLADPATTLAISYSNVFLGAGDTTTYMYAPRFLDDQLQSDLTNAGNQFGNDSRAFADAWAQALSNRLAGWSVGALESAPSSTAQMTAPVIALEMPLATVHIFANLHFVYALLFIFLGLSCLSIPNRPSTGAANRNSGVEDEGSWDGTETQKPVSELALAQARLADPSTLVRELAARSTAVRDPSEAASGGPVYRPVGRRTASQSTLTLRELDGAEQNDVRVVLQRRSDGTLGLQFSHEK